MILIADDNDILRITLSRQLAELGYVSDTVSNGHDVVEYAKTGKYRLILMDVTLPQMDGFEATRVIRQTWQSQKKPHLPIVAVTEQADQEACLQAGMDDCVIKPIRIENLRSVTEKWVPQSSGDLIEQIFPALCRVLRRTRESKNTTVQQVAMTSGIDPEHLAQFEEGDTHFSIGDLVRLCLALDVSVSQVIDEAEREISGPNN